MSSKKIRKGTKEWWLFMVLAEAGNHIRKRDKIAKGETVKIPYDEVEKARRRLNRNPFKRLWYLLTYKGFEIIKEDKDDKEGYRQEK